MVRSFSELSRRLSSPPTTLIRGGPFSGMIYAERSFGSMHLPKLLGTYELELSSLFSFSRLKQYTQIINLGCAEGYYANGAAFILKTGFCSHKVDVIGIDINTEALAQGRRIAESNGLNVRFTIPPVPPFKHSAARRLLICDVEGEELRVIEAQTTESETATDYIIEVHDQPGQTRILDELRARFSSSHNCRTVEFRPRQLNDFPAGLGFEVADEIKLAAMDERRTLGLRWLLMEARKL